MTQRRITAALCGGLLALATTACDDFLSGPGIDRDPNNVTDLTQPGPLYIAMQTSQATQFEGQIARTAAMYTQQLAGFSRQQQGYDIYNLSPSDIDPYWQGVYIGGGLKDARRIQELALGTGDSTYAGIAKVWEAFIIGTAASIWGDIPYREALQFNDVEDPTSRKAAFDPQGQVYADVQAQLDTAILFLEATSATNLGPTGAGRNEELIYAGRSPAALREVYTEVAHTLKARFHLHQAELDESNYARAAAEARMGISTPENDFNFYHSSASNSENIHYQFYYNRGDIGPGAAIINLMKSRIASGKDVNTDRLAFYFSDVCFNGGEEDLDLYVGWRPAGNANLPGGEGSDPGLCGDDDEGGLVSDFNFIAAYADFRQPMITFAETKLILAEACLKIGCQAEAQQALDAVRQNEVYGAIGNELVEFRDQPRVPATLQNIMEQKYIDLFLNPEVWNDFKRTCLPYIAPAPQDILAPEPGQEVAGRIPYGLSEFNTNADNIPNVGATSRNANDPNACPRYTYGGTPAAY